MEENNQAPKIGENVRIPKPEDVLRRKIPISRVAIYLRKSRAEDGVQDLAKHKDYLINIAIKNGWSYELYEEIDSSQDLFRSELQRLRQDIALGKIDAVMVHAVDRLSRRSRHFLEIIEDYFIGKGMTTLFVKDTEHDLKNSTTITMLQLQATLSQAEYSFIVARLNDGRKASLKKGIVTGKLVYGYIFDKKEKKVIPHPEESKIVRLIADMILEGEPYRGVADKLNTMGHKTRKGNYWDIHNIKSIVHSPTIRGHVMQQWGDEEIIVKDSHEPIISDEEYLKIKELTENRADHYKGLKRAPTHWLQGLLTCPKCGRKMSIAGSKPKRKKLGEDLVVRFGEYVYYIRACRPYIRVKEKCGNNGCQAALVEDTIRTIIIEYQKTIEKKLEELLKVDHSDLKTSKKDYLKEINKALKKLEEKEETLLDLLTDKTIEKEAYNKKIAKIKEEKATLITQLHETESQMLSFNVDQEIKQNKHLKAALEKWDELPGEQKRQTLQTIFKEIKYSRFDKNKKPVLDFIPYD